MVPGVGYMDLCTLKIKSFPPQNWIVKICVLVVDGAELNKPKKTNHSALKGK